MIIVRISAGLGNQMFQYMLIVALKQRYPDEVIKVDTSDYRYIHAHTGYVLEKYFDINLEHASINEVNQIRYIPVELSRFELEKNPIIRLYKKILYKKVLKRRFPLKSHNLQESGFNIFHQEIFDLVDGDWYLNGYWQNPMYFANLDQDICSIFKFKRDLSDFDKHILIKIQQNNSVFVHVRRGDYVGSCFAVCKKNYYLEAKNIIDQSVSEPLYVFFSDDIDYVNRSFEEFGNKIVVSHSADDCDFDMQLMSSCKHAILANSSFSYWAAMLKKERGIVICPRYLKLQAGVKYRMPQQADWVYINNIT